MRTAWFNCGAGVAGDMVLGALVDAGADPVFVAEILSGLDLHDYALTFETTQRCGISATHAIVAVHDHEDVNGHHHRAWRAIRSLIETSTLPSDIASRAVSVFEHLATAEAQVHGVDVEEVEFHEVGSIDAIVDIVGVCAALSSLGVDRVCCSPIALGHGLVGGSHGRLPNPAPAVTRLLANNAVPVVGLDDDTELATPTGVALMVALAESFGSMPDLTIGAVGHGAGSRDRPGRANVVSVVIGEEAQDSIIPDRGRAAQLFETNVDDISGEIVAHTISRLLLVGAYDAWATPIVMKKGRPAYTIHALCEPAIASEIARVLVTETGTLGLRSSFVDRWPQQRTESVVRIDGHEIRVKMSAHRIKIEFDDAARAATALGVPVRDIIDRARESIRSAEG